jgi:hypothetical protein
MTLDEIGQRFRTDKASHGHDYLRYYEWFFAPFREEAFTLVEIGGLKGASLRMWSEYFPRARIVCIEVNPELKALEVDRVTVETGDASNRGFLREFRQKYPSARIVLDDGSHRWDHQRIALKELFSIVEPGGYYVAEDIHTSYEKGFAGKDDVPFVDILKRLVDYINLRGEARAMAEGLYSRSMVEIAREVDFIGFVKRACILQKKRGQDGSRSGDGGAG